MKGMTLDFAVTRIFELESKQDVVINRLMIDNYLTSLKKGLAINKEEFLKINQMTEEQMRDENAQKRFVEYASNSELKQFEVKGYEKMLQRILEAPMKSSLEHNNDKLTNVFTMIKSQLDEQSKDSAFIPDPKQKQLGYTPSLLQAQSQQLEEMERELDSD